MDLASALLSDHCHVKGLVLAEEHESDGVLFHSSIIRVGDGNDGIGYFSGIYHAADVLGRHWHLLAVRRASSVQLKIDRAIRAHSLAGALLAGLVEID